MVYSGGVQVTLKTEGGLKLTEVTTPSFIPPPPSFGGGSQNGKFQIISAEYYSQDIKPFLYKRLIKLNTSTGEAWVLVSKIGKNGETRRWLPLEN